MNTDKLQKDIGYTFKNDYLLSTVLTHRSYINEHRAEKLENNERLEFLGDAVLELVTTEYLYRNYHEPEGVMTSWRSALVRGTSLTEIARQIGLDDYMLMSKGESKSSGKSRDVILANATEALIGALYLDGGFSTAEKFVDKYVVGRLKNIIDSGVYRDSKSRLQEISQQKYAITPLYKVETESGPDHDRNYVSSVWIGDKKIARGEGRSKQNSQQSAALEALNIIESISA